MIGTKREAERLAKAALATMPKGKGWKIEVWENLGWHFCLVNAPATIYGYPSRLGDTTYSTLISNNPNEAHYGTMDMSGVKTSSKTPMGSFRKAVKAYKAIMEQKIECLQKCVEALGKAGV